MDVVKASGIVVGRSVELGEVVDVIVEMCCVLVSSLVLPSCVDAMPVLVLIDDVRKGVDVSRCVVVRGPLAVDVRPTTVDSVDWLNVVDTDSSVVGREDVEIETVEAPVGDVDIFWLVEESRVVFWVDGGVVLGRLLRAVGSSVLSAAVVKSCSMVVKSCDVVLYCGVDGVCGNLVVWCSVVGSTVDELSVSSCCAVVENTVDVVGC